MTNPIDVVSPWMESKSLTSYLNLTTIILVALITNESKIQYDIVVIPELSERIHRLLDCQCELNTFDNSRIYDATQ